MAGGIDWFRWHHGSVTDPKFQLVAKKAGARLGDVVAVWAYALEAASASDERGKIGDIDAEAVDCMLGAEDGTTARILSAMQARGLIEDNAIAAWDKRQPKRERPEDNSSARTRSYRDRQASCDATQNHVTPSDATQRQETPRGEERREEKNSSSLRSEGGRAPRSQAIACPHDVSEKVWADWLKLRRAKRAPVTETVLNGAQSEADKAGMTLEAFLRVWCRRGSQGLEAAWLRPDERAGPAETPYARQMREKYETVAPAIAARRPSPLPQPVTFDAEVIEHEQRSIARLVG